MYVPTAEEMATALISIFKVLEGKGLIQNYHVIGSLSSDLKRNKNRNSWSISINKSQPILFKKTKDEQDREITPRITAKKLEVDRTLEFPFVNWDIALEVLLTDQSPLARWHFDLCDPSQDSPRLHMQYGGRFGDHRSDDIPLKIPRWHSPVMDVILLAEIITANFYPDIWREVRDGRNWCGSIHQSQMFCLKTYNDRMLDAMSRSSCTVLNEMWVDKWT